MAHQNPLELNNGRPTILLLGCSHWANHNRDVFNVQHDDMLAPKRQSEIQICIDNLKRFQPTKVAIEIPTEQSHDINEQYRRYRAGTFQLSAEEYHQLGFRIATACQHEEIYAINWNEAIGYDYGMDVIFEFAQKHQPEIYEQLMGSGQRHLEQAQECLSQTTVREQLLEINAPTNLSRDHQAYLMMARIGAGKQYVGIGWVQGWYARNLRIFVNLTRIVTSPQDRVLVIYGSGHLPLLSQYIHDSGLYKLEAVERYL
ncbi:DUF5694 domain-containing protein [Dictyobacter formicarum]|uniref:Haem-binding uptake Tiki superfamily ChaN domain-containing protein n=1 Tax=Dictyobacter formicarum TaxID=2778368 RepID=A0ABQ3VHV7_9CHLR|nr:DUF5694 domain-containing protein [Dictyobacter formicarum]GHO85061.1 hypothetical protein KSZ_30670 [Dictyobacter formicarum]